MQLVVRIAAAVGNHMMGTFRHLPLTLFGGCETSPSATDQPCDRPNGDPWNGFDGFTGTILFLVSLAFTFGQCTLFVRTVLIAAGWSRRATSAASRRALPMRSTATYEDDGLDDGLDDEALLLTPTASSSGSVQGARSMRNPTKVSGFTKPI
jgi:hypothetical protein